MKRFLGRVSLFLFLAVSSLGLLYFLASRELSDPGNFKLPATDHYLVLGHSHPATALNPQFIPGLANLALGGEPFFYTYIKCRYLVSANPQLTTVFIGLTNNQLVREVDSLLTSDYALSYFLPKYAPLMSRAEWRLLEKTNPAGVRYRLGKVAIHAALNGLARSGHYQTVLGGFEALDGYYDPGTVAGKSFRAVYHSDPTQVSELNLNYLDAMVRYLEQHHIAVYFIRTPLREASPALGNEQVFQAVLRSRYPQVRFLDFREYPLSDSDFYDVEHLNRGGARKFSQYFATQLNSLPPSPGCDPATDRH
jgi:hypothetical protein